MNVGSILNKDVSSEMKTGRQAGSSLRKLRKAYCDYSLKRLLLPLLRKQEERLTSYQPKIL